MVLLFIEYINGENDMKVGRRKDIGMCDCCWNIKEVLKHKHGKVCVECNNRLEEISNG